MSNNLYGVYTGTRSRIVEYVKGQPVPIKVMETSDGITHWIRVVQHTKKWLRYALRHDGKEYTIVENMVKVSDEGTVTCLDCARLGPEYPESEDP